MRSRPLFNNRHGFTLVELLVAFILSVIIFGAIAALVSRKSGVQNDSQHIGRLHDAGSLVMETIVFSIKQAGKDTSGSGPMYLTINGNALSIVNAVDIFSFVLSGKKIMMKKDAGDTRTNILPSWGSDAIEVVTAGSAFYGCDTTGVCNLNNGSNFDLIKVVLLLKNTGTGATQTFETKVGLVK